jgi:ubiquinone/menaquinone biosynthesis C-methylase UbiE
VDRAIALLEEVPSKPRIRRGYLDLLGDAPRGSASLSQRLMRSRGLPLIYERFWRPIGVRLFTGAVGVNGALERRATDELLRLSSDELVLDVACGPGNITRRLLASLNDDGFVVGVDASPTMLEQAVRDTHSPNAAYVRCDAQRLPFRDAAFDAVSCYAALYLMDDPFAAIDEMVRVLAPGGRIAVLTSCQRGPEVLRIAAGLFTAPGGIRVFGRDEINDAFAAAGLTDIRQQVTGFAQFVGARKPSPRENR